MQPNKHIEISLPTSFLLSLPPSLPLVLVFLLSMPPCSRFSGKISLYKLLSFFFLFFENVHWPWYKKQAKPNKPVKQRKQRQHLKVREHWPSSKASLNTAFAFKSFSLWFGGLERQRNCKLKWFLEGIAGKCLQGTKKSSMAVDQTLVSPQLRPPWTVL